MSNKIFRFIKKALKIESAPSSLEKPPAPAAGDTAADRRSRESGTGDTAQTEKQTRRGRRKPRRDNGVSFERRDVKPAGEVWQPKPKKRPPKKKSPPPPAAAETPAQDFGPWDPASFVVPPEKGHKRFHDFDLQPEIMRAVQELGFRYCTPIQAGTFEPAMSGRNVAGRAQTGTGKTAAFLITILQRMLKNPASRPDKPGRPAALVIGPTRELVIQIASDAELLGKYAGLRCVSVFGGMDYARQQEQIAAGPVDLVVATPGRLLDFYRSRVLNLRDVHTLVIDEADRMLDMGFIPDVRRIISALPPRDKRQTMLFSATLTEDVMRLASQWMPDPVKVSIEEEDAVVPAITQIVYPIAAREKFTVLYNLLQREKSERVLVFRNRRIGCERLMQQLSDYDIPCAVLSGDVDQKKRLRVLENFRDGKIKVVVATDVAGRGIHVDDIGFVVNYDFPYEPDDYIHRIGRTGRAGSSGTAISFACEDESFIIPEIEELIGEELSCPAPPEELLAPLPEVTRRRTHSRSDRKQQDRKTSGPSRPRRAAGTSAGQRNRRPPRGRHR